MSGTVPCTQESRLIERREQIIQRFSQGWMGEDRVTQGCVGYLSHHCYLQQRHHFSALNSQNGSPKDLICLRVNHCFDKSSGLVHFERADDGGHGHFGDLYRTPLSTRLRLAQANTPELRVNENGV